MTDLNSSRLHHAPNPWALTPLVVFLLSYLVVSIIAGDFYKMPITVAFVIASVVAIAMSKGGKISNRIEQFCRGAANSNIMLMVLIFIPCRCFRPNSQSDGSSRCYRESGHVHPTWQFVGSPEYSLLPVSFPFLSGHLSEQSLPWLLLP